MTAELVVVSLSTIHPDLPVLGILFFHPFLTLVLGVTRHRGGGREVVVAELVVNVAFGR